MNIIERDNNGVRPEYVNSFRTYAGNGEVILELSQVDLVATLKSAESGKEPESLIADVRGRFLFRPEQIQQLIQTLVSAISAPAQQPPAPKENKA